MKKIIFLLIFLVVLGVSFISFSWWKNNTKPVSSDRKYKSFIIPKGKSAIGIGNELYSQGLIRSPLAFKIYVQFSAKEKKIQSGEFKISPSFTMFEVVDQLTKGPVELWVTIPEGLRREEIAEKFITGLEMTADGAQNFRNEFYSQSVGQEGFLFPDTYLFPKTASASAVINKMLDTFDKRVDSDLRQQVEVSGLTLKQVVTLASIIERETISLEERSIVAGILLKRLDSKWPLQADASLQYAVAVQSCKGEVKCNWWPILSREDLEIDSPYNTYKRQGFPPSPIANPGISSIKAVISPEKSEYWYYIHDSKGIIHYARTLEEHNLNISRYLGK